MALIHGSKPDLIDNVNRQALTDLDHEGLIFSPVKGNVDETDDRKTKVRLTGKDEYQYRGSEVVTYQRLDLSVLPTLFLNVPRISPRPTLYELLPAIEVALGIRLGERDVYDSEVIELEGQYRVTLNAKPDSYGWIGACTLTFIDLPPISIPITHTEIRW